MANTISKRDLTRLERLCQKFDRFECEEDAPALTYKEREDLPRLERKAHEAGLRRVGFRGDPWVVVDSDGTPY